jgi:hypothetical protein
MAAIEHEIPAAGRPSSNSDGIPACARQRTGSPRQAFAACAVGAVVLALLNSPGTEQAGPRSVTAVIRQTTNLWAEEAARLGLSAPQQAMRRVLRQFIDLQWR